jgi:oligosaccharide repeat unit polymerase
LLAEIVSGARSELRDSLSTTAGITTFTQFGVAYVIAYALKSGAGIQPISRLERAGLILVFVLAAFRAFAWAERLAVTELIVCWTITRMAYLPITRPSHWRIANVAPTVAPFGLYLIFTASEYFRSWEYYTNQYDSVWAFTLDRLLAYYATAVNNGIGVLVDTTGWPHYSGAFVVESLYRMPGLGPLLQQAFSDPRTVPHDWLEVYARPEFNSPTDYFRIVLDLGFFGAALYYLLLGYVIGRAYDGLRQGRTFGLLGYGVLVLQLMESLRYGYIGEARFVPLLIGLLLVAADMHRQRERAVNAAWQAQRSRPAHP